MKDKNENRKGYKKTKVGWIPEEWAAILLKEACVKIGSGITPSPSFLVTAVHKT